MNTSRNKEVRWATRWSGLEIGLRYILQFGVMIALARFVEPAAFGLVAMVMVFTALGTIIVDSGTGTALIQRQHTTPDEETSTFVVNLACSLVACLALMALAVPIARFYGHPELARICVVMSLIFPLNGLAVVPDAILTQKLRFDARTKVELGTSLMSGLVAIGVAALGYGVWALVWQALTSIGSRVVMLYAVSGWRPRGRFRRADARTITSFGGYMLAVGLIDTAYTRLQAVLIGKMFSSNVLGQYTLAQNTQQAPIAFANGLLNRLGLPVLSSVKSDLVEARRMLRAALRLSLFAFAPMMAILAVLSVPIVTVVYGPRWTLAGDLLAILVIGALTWPANVLNMVALNSQGRPQLVLRVEIAKKLIGVGLLFAAAPWGLTAIAWSTVVVSLFSLFLNGMFVAKVMHYRIGEQLYDLGTAAIPTVGAALAAEGCRHWLGASILAVAASIGISAVATIAIGMAIRHPAIPGILQLIRRSHHEP